MHRGLAHYSKGEGREGGREGGSGGGIVNRW